MKMWKLRLRNLSLLMAATMSIGGSLLFLPAAPAVAQVLLQEQGSLRPTQDEYAFSGTAGQAVAISMASDEFDTLLVLLDPDNQEIARNDDYARSLNSTIIITLPRDGEYKVLARSFSGMGGNYSLTVRPATAYDQAYARAVEQYQQGMFAEAISAYTEAIRVDPNQAVAYIERADARYAQTGTPSPEMVADYERAADLYQQSGDVETAQSLREQIEYLQSQPQNPEPRPLPAPTP
jgi:tetratricopeptide (TPR) repeat protein